MTTKQDFYWRKEKAEAVRLAAANLNQAIRDAQQAGLMVRLSTFSEVLMGLEPEVDLVDVDAIVKPERY